ncbi:MAG: UDP-N-acetylmuramoyl-L-alanyl-D-glutamate--2,6-diaminopimelate ligase [Candidatus Omnitrophica bacterium]|nr:UDP-N-acetylmuramoyl-L-alanyl-D-glutamate--2,6-diaminopimelate ligase [Candidatus Omnitrophota bacterium]
MITVKDTREELSRLAAGFYDYPSKKMKVIGITGTNGKTTTSFLLDRILTDAGFKTGLIGTILYKIGKRKITANRTTPDALRLNNILHQMIGVKTDYAILEISSHALEQKRVNDIYYDMALFTNLTPEHLDYHKDMDAYFKAKAKIFNNLKDNGIAILNKDDSKTRILLKKINKKIFTYGINSKADIMAAEIESNIKGSSFKVITPSGKCLLKTKLLGLHNISNILAAVSASCVCNLSLRQIQKSINSFHNMPGRLESIHTRGGFSVFVDYAHTEDALGKALFTLRSYAEKRIITVFGCGGNRDKSKRPRMGKIATKISDYTIITNDNPRGELPGKIAKDIEKGINSKGAKYSIILDRKEAIRKALETARKGDMVLIAGKGHETEQVIGHRRIKFDDREVVRRLLKKCS